MEAKFRIKTSALTGLLSWQHYISRSAGMNLTC
jgi:hypothetical protein